MRRFQCVIAAFGAVTTAVALGAWTFGSARAAAVVLTPGSADLITSHLRDTSMRYRYLMRAATGDTSEKEMATGRAEVHLTQHQGHPAMLLVTTTTRSGATSSFVDTALVMRASLAPVWEVSRYGGRVLRWEYAGTQVRRTLTHPDSGTTTREHEYDVPVFHFNQLDVLIRSIPLREGYEAILPLYSEGSDELEMDSVRVLPRGADGVWPVRFADPAIVATYGVDGGTRRILRYEVVVRTTGARNRRVPIE